MEPLPSTNRPDLPILLCLSETSRPGRPADLDESILPDLEDEVGVTFSREYSEILSLGRAGGLVALDRAQTLLIQGGVPQVLIAGVDSLLVARSLAWLEDQDRLLTDDNSNGVIPGEAAGCVLLERSSFAATDFACVGIGLGHEPVTIYSDGPFRADGLTNAVRAALDDARLDLADCSLRLTDISGEHYYFREAALALGRILRREGCREIWHPAECIGEVGAAISPVLLGYASVAARKDYLPGSTLIVQSSSDEGVRAAVCLTVLGKSDVQ